MGFKRAPREVKEAFVALKQTLNKPISLHKISGNYYVYEYSSARDQKEGKTIIKTAYLGRMSKDGRFAPKKDQPGANQGPEQPMTTQMSNEVDEREAIALRNLSMNGRMSMTKLAKRLGMSTTGARHFVKRLEERYKIKYFAELNTLKLGYLRYIALVKFEDKIPKIDEIKEAFEEDSHVAFVAMTKGIYDMVVIFYLESTVLMANFIYEWRSSKALPNYTARWHITPLDMASGITMPLRKQVVEWIAEGVSSVRKDTKFAVQLTEIEGLVLKEMAINGTQDFNDIDKRYNLGLGRSNYAFYKLEEKGIIERITITVTMPHLRYNAIFITETNNYKKFTENQDQWRINIIGQNSALIDKYVFRGDMGIPDSIFQICPIFDSSTFQKAAEELNSTPGTKIDSMIVTDVVVGSLCYRNFDPRYTTVYDVLVKHGKLLKEDKSSY
jgi:DNA-binding Lrp family transcriptional regulator